jgi:hypothetical protein
MKKPHIERFWTHDIYISPLEMVGGRDEGGTWFEPGETKQTGNLKITFQGFVPEVGRRAHEAHRSARGRRRRPHLCR